jgi:hypothetical protein
LNKVRIAIIGSYTIDEIDNLTQIGGIIYSSYGVWKAGGLSILPQIKNYKIENPYTYDYLEIFLDKIIKFKININENKRKLILINKRKKIILNKNAIIGVDGILFNPICNEIEFYDIQPFGIPIAVDIQGMVRECKESNEITLKNNNNIKFYNKDLFVLHGNNDEINCFFNNTENIFKIGFKEVLISYGKDGFELITNNFSKFFFTDLLGNYNVGNGDVLLSSYFTLRLNGHNPINAAETAKKITEEFSNFGLPLKPRIY